MYMQIYRAGYARQPSNNVLRSRNEGYRSAKRAADPANSHA